MKKKLIALGALSVAFISSLLPLDLDKTEEVYAAGYCRSYVDGAWHDGSWYSRNYDYSTNLPRAGYMRSDTSFSSSPPLNYTDYYAPQNTSSLINSYGWSQSFWNIKKSQQWQSGTIYDATNYSPPGTATHWQVYSTGSGPRFRSENGNYYRYRKAVRVYRTHDQQVYDATAPSISANPQSGGWTNGSHSVSFSFSESGCAGYYGYRFDWSTNSTASWSAWSTASSGSKTLSSEGVYYFHLNTQDKFGNSRSDYFGPYRIDKTVPSLNGSWIFDNPYTNGNDYWVQPGDTIRIRIKGYDSASEIKDSYLRLSNGAQDNRSHHYWGGASNYNNEFMTGPYSDIIGATRVTDSGGYREPEWTVKILSGANNQDLNVTGYLGDYAGNNSGNYFDTGKNVRVDGTAPTVSASPSSANWSQGVNVSMPYSDSRSGVSAAYCAWSTSTSTPTSYQTSGCGSVSQSNQGTWYLHYKTTDRVGNLRTGYFGPYKVDKTDPTGVFSPNSSGWTKNNVSVVFNPSDSGGSGVKQWRYRLSSNDGSSWGSWSSWITGDTNQTITLSTTGYWKIQSEVVDNALNYGYPMSGTYYIDKTLPYHLSNAIYDARYQNGNDYWIRPNDTVRLVVRGGDDNSGLHLHYARLYGSGNDMRTVHDWTGTSTNFAPVNSSYVGTYTNATAASETYESGTHKEVTFWAKALSNSDNKDFDFHYYLRDSVVNIIGYNDTSKNLRIDGTAPTVTANPSSKTWTNATVNVDLTFTDTRSGVKVKQYAWSTSTATPTTWTNYTGTVSQPAQGVWYLHYKTLDNVDNTRTGYFGQYKIDLSKPSGTYTPNSSPWIPTDITTTFNPSDTGGSGVDNYRYRISSNDGSTYGNWSSYFYGDNTTNISMTSSGWWKIQTLVYDIAGNSQTVTSGTFLVDKTDPNGVITENPANVWTRYATLTGTGSDGHSGFKRIQIPDGLNGASSTWVTGTTASHPIDKNGTYTFVFEDNVGNTTTKSFTVSNIDDVAPHVWSVTKSPNGPTNQNVTITINTGDGHSGVDRIVLPNGTAVYNSTANYSVPANGSYTFTVYDKVGNSYSHTVYVNNIDKVMPTLDYLTLLQKKDGKFQVTVNTSDNNGIQSVSLNTGQNIIKDPNKNYYFVDNLTTKPVYIRITDNAGNVTNPIYFLDIPTLAYDATYSSTKVMKEDVKVNINGTQTLSYKLGMKDFECSTKPCTITFTKNDEATAINSMDKFVSIREFEITNIDKTDVNLVLEGDRDVNNVMKLTWNLTLANTKLICQSSSDYKLFSPSGTTYSFSGLEETYKCIVEGNYQGNLEKSNTVTLHPDYSEDPMVYTPPTNMSQVPFKKVFMEKSATGQIFYLNINRDNTEVNQKLVPVPDSLQ